MKLQSVDLNNTILWGRQVHFTEIKDRLDFLSYILLHSGLMLSVQQIDSFWSSLIMNALTKEERDISFAWLENVRGANQVHSLLALSLVFTYH